MLTDDTSSMIDFELEELGRSDAWRRVLAAYDDDPANVQPCDADSKPADADSKPADAGSQGWLPRTLAVEGVPRSELPRIHGKLIAIGFLDIRLADRTTGVRYQLSPLGRQALGAMATPSSDTEFP